MFLFSKKLLLLIVVVALVFGGERQFAEALKCWNCGGSDNLCDAEQNGVSENCEGACAVKINGNAINKYCEVEEATWLEKDAPKCVKGIACYCIKNDCNKPEDFGVTTGTGGGASTTTGSSLKSGARGKSSMSSAWMIMVAVSMMMVVGPSAFIAQ